MPPTRIRIAQVGDLDALVALEEASFDHDRVSRAQWRRHLASSSAVVLVAEATGILLGNALLLFRRGSLRARLYSIAVSLHARGRGTGAALLETAEFAALSRGCDRIRLEVRTDNQAAMKLYEKHGYARHARVARFYENGADAWRYEKVLRACRP